MAAAVLALLAGFGLHPEPIGSAGLASHRGLSSAHMDEAPHACPMCLTHSAALTAPPSGMVTCDAGGTRSPRLPEDAAPSLRAALDLSGRSPPSPA